MEDAATKAFKEVDKDASGDLDVSEFRKFMKKLGMQDDAKIDYMFQELDDTCSGKVDEKGIRSWYLTSAFIAKESTVDMDVFKDLLQELNPSFPKEVVERLFHHADSNGNGTIQVQELAAFYMKYQTARDALDGADVDKDGKLDKAEFKRMLSVFCGIADDSKAESLFKEVDTDGSGKIEIGELLVWCLSSSSVEIKVQKKFSPPPRCNSKHKVNVGGTQAYICVPTKCEKEVLSEGYKCKARNRVPCHQHMREAVKNMLKNNKADESILLEVFGVPDNMLYFPPEGGGGGNINVKHLHQKFLRSGRYKTRMERKDDTCMFCGQTDSLDKERVGKLGQALYRGDAFLCSPCTNEACVDKMLARSDRLDNGPVLELYHAANEAVAKSIEEESHGNMIRGDFFDKAGAAGGGIYFAHTARETSWKYEADKATAKVIFKCKVKMGTSIECPYRYPDASKDGMFRLLINHEQGPYDSVILDRAAKAGNPGTYPVPDAPIHGTRIEELASGEKLHPGYEFVVYSWDQVTVVERVKDDPPPPGHNKKQASDGSWVKA